MVHEHFTVSVSDRIEDALRNIELNQHGIVFVLEERRVIGCATDGDIRRALLEGKNLQDNISHCVNKAFVHLSEEDASRENLLKHLDSRIKVIPVLKENGELCRIVSNKTLSWRFEGGVVSKAKAPVRISFAGGGTDLTGYFSENNGVVLNTTINKFAHATLLKRNDKKILIRSNDMQCSAEAESLETLSYDGNLDLLKAVIKVLRPEYGFELFTYSDVPPGSGMGGSAVLLSAVIGAFNNFREILLDRYEIAELAFHAERIELGLSGGWQDQYAAVFGGFNFMEFTKNDNLIHPLRLPQSTLMELEDSLILCYSGINHNSGNIHDDQRERMKDADVTAYAEASKDIAYEMKARLLKGRLDDFGQLLDQAWQIKKKFSSKITSSFLDEMYDFAMAQGALGGKLLGAGGGGYFLFYVPTFKKFDIMNALREKGFTIETFTFDSFGLRSWTTRT